MNQKEIEQEAKRLEEVSERSVSAFAGQLHDMKPEDRLAVAKQIQWDQQQHPSDSLPKLDFYTDGDVKTAVSQSRDQSGATEERRFDDNTGKLVSRRLVDRDGIAENYQHDPKTGKLTTYDKTNPADGSSEHSEFAPNGNRTTMITVDGKGNRETVTYDSDAGKQVASDIRFKDKSTMHLVFDSDGGVKEVDFKDQAGNVRQWKRDTQDKSEATVEQSQNEYTGLKRMDIKFKDGAKVHLDFDSVGFLNSLYTVDTEKNISSLKRR